jgi:hypothetical protein
MTASKSLARRKAPRPCQPALVLWLIQDIPHRFMIYGRCAARRDAATFNILQSTKRGFLVSVFTEKVIEKNYVG